MNGTGWAVAPPTKPASVALVTAAGLAVQGDGQEHTLLMMIPPWRHPRPNWLKCSQTTRTRSTVPPVL
jgi:hypothetical protein